MLPLFNIKTISIGLSYLFLFIVIYAQYRSNLALNQDLGVCNGYNYARNEAVMHTAEVEKASHSKANAAQKLACININGLSNEEKLDLNVRLKIAHDEACAAQKEYSDAFNEYYAGLKESTK